MIFQPIATNMYSAVMLFAGSEGISNTKSCRAVWQHKLTQEPMRKNHA